MKKLLMIIFLALLGSCQFFFPTSSIDNDSIQIRINDSIYLISDFNYSLVKKSKQGLDFIVVDSIDSLSIEKQIILYRNRNYFYLDKDTIFKTKKINGTKMKATNLMLRE